MIFFKITVVPIAVCGSGDSECLQLRRGSLYIKSIKGQPLIATIIPLKIEMKLKKQIIKKTEYTYLFRLILLYAYIYM